MNTLKHSLSLRVASRYFKQFCSLLLTGLIVMVPTAAMASSQAEPIAAIKDSHGRILAIQISDGNQYIYLECENDQLEVDSCSPFVSFNVNELKRIQNINEGRETMGNISGFIAGLSIPVTATIFSGVTLFAGSADILAQALFVLVSSGSITLAANNNSDIPGSALIASYAEKMGKCGKRDCIPNMNSWSVSGFRQDLLNLRFRIDRSDDIYHEATTAP